MACKSDSAQAAKQCMMQSDAAQLMWRQCRDGVPERAASDPIRAGCEPAALPRVEQVPMCMFCARDAPGQRLRGVEGQICGRICGVNGMIACFRALLCVSSGGMCSDAKCLVSAFGRRWREHAEERASGVLEGVAELRRERVRQTMCGHREAVARKAFRLQFLIACEYFLLLFRRVTHPRVTMADAKRFTWGTDTVGDVKQNCEIASCAHVGYEVPRLWQVKAAKTKCTVTTKWGVLYVKLPIVFREE